MTYQLRLREEPSDFSSEFDEYEGGLLEGEPEFEPESDEFEAAFADLEEEEEAGRGARAAGSRIGGHTPPMQLRFPAPRRRRLPRTTIRPWRVSAGVIDEPSICICPEQTCPQHGSEYIRWVQSTLNRILGMRLPLDGVLTSATRSAIRSFQERENLPGTGIVGPDTERALIAARSGQSPGAGAMKTAEPGMTGPAEPSGTPPEPDSPKPAAEFDFEWESFNPGGTQDKAAARQDQIAFEAELGVGETPFGETFFEVEHESAPSDVQAFAAALGAEWSKRRNGDPSPDAMTAWLLRDYQDTLEGARRRWGKKFGAGRFTVEALGGAWKVSRTENMKFQGGSRGARALGKFDPPAENVALVTSALIEDSDKAPVAPLLVKFVEELRRRYSGFVRASNYRRHGGGKFNNRGHSLDLFIKGLDDRGFYPKDGAVKLLRAVHEAASAIGAQWRVIYNDFQVADVVNRALSRQHVIFVGSTRKTGNTVTGLNWHGPAPLILHFHLDLAPLAGGSPSSWKGVFGSVSSSGSSSSEVSSVPPASVPSAGSPSADTVCFAQRVLNASERERLDVDGDLGPRTRAALERFRQRYALGRGGILDAATDLALAQRVLEELAQQSMFARIGVRDAVTGPAIARFKSERGLGFDATIDAATRGALADALVRRTAPAPTEHAGAANQGAPQGPFGTLTSTAFRRQFSYQFTPEDVLWTARFLVGEAGGRDDLENHAVTWAMFNRYALFTHNVYPTFQQFIRAYSTPLQPVLKSVGAARRHMNQRTFVHTGGNYPGTTLPRGQLRRHLELQAMPWNQLPASARSLAERALKGEIPNPIGNASEFGSTYVYFHDRNKRYPNQEEWKRFTEAYAQQKKRSWIGPVQGLNQRGNAFFVDRRAANLPPGSVPVIQSSQPELLEAEWETETTGEFGHDREQF